MAEATSACAGLSECLKACNAAHPATGNNPQLGGCLAGCVDSCDGDHAATPLTDTNGNLEDTGKWVLKESVKRIGERNEAKTDIIDRIKRAQGHLSRGDLEL